MPTSVFAIAASGDDRYPQRDASTVWPPNTTTAFNTNWTELYAQKMFASPNYTVRATLLSFDTSGTPQVSGVAIPDDATITSATLDLYVLGHYGSDAWGFRGRYYPWVGTDAADYTAADTDTAGVHAFGPITLGGLTNGQVNNIALSNLSNINLSGTTKFRLTLDLSGAPTTDNTVAMASFDNTTLVEPRLTVNYTEITYDETMRPTGVSGLVHLSGSHTDIDQDPDGTITDAGLVHS